MSKMRHLGAPLRRAVVVVVGGCALAVTALTVAGGSPPFTDRTDQAAASAGVQAPGPVMFPLFARKSGHLYDYEPKGSGAGLKPLVDMGGGWADADALVQVNLSENGSGNDLYHVSGTTLYYTAERGGDTKVIGGGWDQYNLLVSVGNMGGSSHPDLVARKTDGTLWLYQGRADGTLAARIQIGTGGWNALNALAGRGDYTGDGKADLIARDADGDLYVYPGTGTAVEYAALGARTTIGWGWQVYKSIVSTGDNDGDGKTDLIANDSAGLLWFYKGTGSASAPLAAKAQIGTAGWAAFDTLF
ncbi:FG-GAP-like repeat-containing protein [Streptomyces sp.]|uniref:FG-GAP-like repeat-containing protein n=1 Tax=Streptomyces sp. TaxID=1931 RepID=UPI0028117956|nr:FG-GAP-like repeat-containing protein [Streptomyces sp.]